MPSNSISRIPSRKPFEKVIEMNRKQPVKSTFYRLFFCKKAQVKPPVKTGPVVNLLSKPEMSTNFGEMSTSKVRKKPDFSGFLSGSGEGCAGVCKDSSADPARNAYFRPAKAAPARSPSDSLKEVSK